MDIRARTTFALAALLCANCTATEPVDPDFPDGYPDPSMPGKADHSTVTQIPYKGGIVLHQPTAVHVYWGAYWNSADGVRDRAMLDAFEASASASSWYDTVLQYPDGHGAPGYAQPGDAVVIDDPALEPASLVSDHAIRKFLSARFADQTIGYGTQTLFTLFPPPHVVISTPWGKSCQDICGYHYHFPGTTTGSATHDILYAVIPYLNCGGCNAGVSVNGKSMDGITVTLSHELAESVTDPNCDAWTTGHGQNEVGDLCDTGTTVHWSGYDFAVQDLWSNADKRCVH